MKDTLSYQLFYLLKNNNISLDYDELSFQIKSHPTHPSLHSVTGVLDHFNIENIALDVPTNTETLNQLPNSFLAQVEIDLDKQFAVIIKTKEHYKIIFDSKTNEVVTQSEFLKLFTGIILVVNSEETATNLKNNNSKSILKKSLKFFSITIVGVLLIVSNPELETILFLILSLLGLFVSISILKQEQGENNFLGDAFCTKQSIKSNCSNVLNSKGSIITKGFKISDLSFIYFTALVLTTLLLAINNNDIFIPKLVSLITLPVTLYSIYYQSIVLKKWCLLCLSIVLIMWLQATLTIIYFSPSYDIKSILVTGLSFISIGLFWIIEGKILNENKKLKDIKIDYFKFKRNFELFNNQLKKSKRIDTKIENTKEIVFGNPNSNLDIIIITNPMCGHCKAVHKTITQILNRYEATTKITIRFNLKPNKTNNTAAQIGAHLLEIYNISDKQTCLNAFHDIYNNYLPNQWLEKWKTSSDKTYYHKILENEYLWCISNAINFTPEIFINGRAFPKIYNRNDLILFIDDLIENSINSSLSNSNNTKQITQY